MANMAEQMELFEPVTRGFQEGGLKDEGGKTDPVSGNEVPPGSLREEVRDDIPAQLSEGEFVFPADVVRYIGLETLMRMRQEAKQGLAQMEAMGQMGNSEEATMPDDLPFDMYDLEVEDDGLEMQTGGMVPNPVTPTTNAMTGTQTAPIGTASAPVTPASASNPYDPNLGQTLFTPTTPQVQYQMPTFYGQTGFGPEGVEFETVTYVNEAGQTIQFKKNKQTGQLFDMNGNPATVPEGYSLKAKEEEQVETTPTTGVRTQTTRVRDDGGREDETGPTGATLSFGGTKGRRSSGFGGDEVLGAISGSLSFGTTTTDPITGVVTKNMFSNPYAMTGRLGSSFLETVTGKGQPLSLQGNEIGILNGNKKGLRMDGNLITNATITFEPEVYNSVVTRQGKNKVTTRQELANTVKSIGSLYGKNYDGEMTYKEAKDLADAFSDGKGNVDIETLEKTYGDDFIDRMNTDRQFAREVGRAMDETANGLKGMTQAQKDRFKGLMDGSISPDTGPEITSATAALDEAKQFDRDLKADSGGREATFGGEGPGTADQQREAERASEDLGVFGP